MSAQPAPTRFGPYRLVRRCADHPLAERWIGLHERDLTNTTLYRFRLGRDHAEMRGLLASLEAVAAVQHAHLQPIVSMGIDDHHHAWAVAPYTGNHTGLVSLADLIARKAAAFSPTETRRAADQMLTAVQAAHAEGLAHGPIALDEIQVDRGGSLSVELYGLRRRLAGEPATPALVRDEIRSIVAVVYRMLTALPADEPRVAASRLVRRLDRVWDAWFDAGLDPAGGFASAADALRTLQAGGGAPSSTSQAGRPAIGWRPWRRTGASESERLG